MSLNNINSNVFPATLSGLDSINLTNITINGQDISTLFVPYTNATANVNLGNKALTTNQLSVSTTLSTDASGNLSVGKYVYYDISGNAQQGKSMFADLSGNLYLGNTAFSPDPSGNLFLSSFGRIDPSGNLVLSQLTGNGYLYSDASGNTTIRNTVKVAPKTDALTYYFPMINGDTSGNYDVFSDGTGLLNYVPSTGILTTNKLKIGNVPVGSQTSLLAVDSGGNVIQGTVSTNAQTIVVAPKTNNQVYYPTFINDDVSGNYAMNMDGGGILNYNPSTGVLAMNQASLQSQSIGSTGFFYPAMVRQNIANYAFYASGIQSQLYQTAGFAVDASNNRVIINQLRIPTLSSVNLAVDVDGNVISAGAGSISQALTNVSSIYYPLMSVVNTAGTLSTAFTDVSGNFNFNKTNNTLYSPNASFNGTLQTGAFTSNSANTGTTTATTLSLTSLASGTPITNGILGLNALNEVVLSASSSSTINTSTWSSNIYFLGSTSSVGVSNATIYAQNVVYVDNTLGILYANYGLNCLTAGISAGNLTLNSLATGTVTSFLGVDSSGNVFKTSAGGATITVQSANQDYYLIGTNPTSGVLSVASIDSANRFYWNPSTGYLFCANLGVTGANGSTIANATNPIFAIQTNAIGTAKSVFLDIGISTAGNLYYTEAVNDSIIKASNSLWFGVGSGYAYNFMIGTSRKGFIDNGGNSSTLRLSTGAGASDLVLDASYNVATQIGGAYKLQVFSTNIEADVPIHIIKTANPLLKITNTLAGTQNFTSALVTTSGTYFGTDTAGDTVNIATGSLWTATSGGYLNFMVQNSQIVQLLPTYAGFLGELAVGPPVGSSGADSLFSFQASYLYGVNATIGYPAGGYSTGTQSYKVRFQQVGSGSITTSLEVTPSLVTSSVPISCTTITSSDQLSLINTSSNKYTNISTPNGGSGNPVAWTGGVLFTNTYSTSGTAQGLNIGYYNAVGYGLILCLQPSVAWKDLYITAGTTYIGYQGTYVAYTNSGGWVNVSDEREKTNIKPLKTTSSLQRVLSAKTFTYNRIYNLDENGNDLVPAEEKEKPLIGVLAQQVQESNPYCLSTWTNEAKEERFGVNYNDYVVHLIGSVQELNAKITTQEAQIEQQSSQIQTLNDHLSALTKVVNDLIKSKK